MDYLYALQCIREASPEAVNFFFIFVSEYLLKAALVYLAIVYWCVDKREGSTMLLGYACAYQVNQLLKNIFYVDRPWHRDSRLHIDKYAEKGATGYSFPSGHSVTAGATYGSIAAWQKKRTWVVVLMSILIFLTAFSRNWLGAHTLWDVMVAVIEAALVICIANYFKLYIANHPEKDTVITVTAIIIAIIILAFLQFKPYPKNSGEGSMNIYNPWKMMKDCYTACGIVTGGFLGWKLERRYVKFTNEGTKKQLILRGVIGVLSFGIIYVLGGVITKALIPEHFDHLVKYFILFFYTMFIYPLIFSKLEKKNMQA